MHISSLHTPTSSPQTSPVKPSALFTLGRSNLSAVRKMEKIAGNFNEEVKSPKRAGERSDSPPRKFHKIEHQSSPKNLFSNNCNYSQTEETKETEEKENVDSDENFFIQRVTKETKEAYARVKSSNNVVEQKSEAPEQEFNFKVPAARATVVCPPTPRKSNACPPTPRKISACPPTPRKANTRIPPCPFLNIYNLAINSGRLPINGEIKMISPLPNGQGKGGYSQVFTIVDEPNLLLKCYHNRDLGTRKLTACMSNSLANYEKASSLFPVARIINETSALADRYFIVEFVKNPIKPTESNHQQQANLILKTAFANNLLVDCSVDNLREEDGIVKLIDYCEKTSTKDLNLFAIQYLRSWSKGALDGGDHLSLQELREKAMKLMDALTEDLEQYGNWDDWKKTACDATFPLSPQYNQG